MKQRNSSRNNNHNTNSKRKGKIVIYILIFVLLIVVLVIIININHLKTIKAITKSIEKSLNENGKNIINNIKMNNNINVDSNNNLKADNYNSNNNIEIELDNNKKNSRFAYVTLISGIDNSFKYRGFLYACMIMNKALKSFGSTADFIALIGYNQNDRKPFINDMNLLKKQGIIVHNLHRLVHSSNKLSFAEMALLKVTPWNFTEYDRIQFFDGDVMPTKNMDCFFQLSMNTFTVGLVSPLNSGWYLGIPNKNDYNILHEKSKWRLERDWDKKLGWGDAMPKGMTYRGGKIVKEWEFNGADMDQGLLAHYFVINKGNAILIDTDLNQIRIFNKGIKYSNPEISSLEITLKYCDGNIPTNFFAHFTGRSKPWMLNLTDVILKKRNTAVLTWLKHLDSLNMEINSSNIMNHSLGSPLGYFNANFPKGGIKGGFI